MVGVEALGSCSGLSELGASTPGEWEAREDGGKKGEIRGVNQ